MKNNIKNLSSIGYDNYYLTESGKLYKAASTFKEIKADKNNRLYLVNQSGKSLRITTRQLYKKVFKKQLCIDEIENLNNEEWKLIENTEEKYFISNCGRVKSYCGNKAIILKPYLNSQGYLIIKINQKNIRIHQLVANAFCENRYKGTETKIEIHHKNRNKQDNRAENLLIVSVEEHHKIHNEKETTDNG